MRCLLAVLVACVLAQPPEYFLGDQGQSCFDFCLSKNLNCDPHIVTGDKPDLFKQLGADCTPDTAKWWAEDQPSWVTNRTDPNYGKCLGYVDVPGGVLCSASHPSVRRVCHCVKPEQRTTVGSFGTGCSQCAISTTEKTFYAHVVAGGSYGVMNHFWVTAPNPVLNDAIFRYYIDGETTASIQFLPDLFCGVGFNDTQAPWGTKWFGKGASDGAWFNNFQIPFQKSVRVTIQHRFGTYGGFYFIVRGTPNIPVTVGNVVVPAAKAKLVQYRTTNLRAPAYEYITLLDQPTGSGVFFMHSLAVQSIDMNFLEGCYHAYTPYSQTFPGELLSTGTEDYFDSAWYFNAGEFHFPVSGFTHLKQSPGLVTWSAYRFHEMDPLPFTDGFRFVWRNGDVSSGGVKCFTADSSKGEPVVRDTSAPLHLRFGPSTVNAYAWAYVWDA